MALLPRSGKLVPPQNPMGSPGAELLSLGAQAATSGRPVWGGCPVEIPSSALGPHLPHRAGPPLLILPSHNPDQPHTGAQYLIRGVGVGPPMRRGKQETLPIENTAVAEEIDRKTNPALWQRPGRECQLL